MPDSPALALQKAVSARLKASPAVAGLVGGRVYDEPRQGVVFPYIRLGTFDVRPLRMSGDCVDIDIMFAVECHSRPGSVAAGVTIQLPGRTEAAAIAHAVVEALDDAPLTVTGHLLDWCQWMTQAVSRDADGKSYIATVAFQAALSRAD